MNCSKVEPSFDFAAGVVFKEYVELMQLDPTFWGRVLVCFGCNNGVFVC